ncbi:hypothetical protein PSN13_04043 [Micromonospora saelicesensis]|uniref:Uncharacterized protein n=1 Tax=Micromonospora saelicesensis TaxID=285676 RepID=A0A328NIF4_9ACTN|nr:hypothetical protein PSN13_04043 [Micromonospora saelicesensis]
MAVSKRARDTATGSHSPPEGSYRWAAGEIRNHDHDHHHQQRMER